RIAPETRERILEAARKLRYRPNAAARALANRRMDTLGVAAVIEGGELNQYFLEVINGVLDAASGHNQNTTVFTLHDWAGDAARISQFCDGRIDGMVLLAPICSREVVDHLPDHTPFVSIHANIAAPPGMVNLESDEEAGACNLVRHLISRGHRRIMHISGPRGLLGAERRIDGYRRALAEAGIAFDPTLLLEAGYTTPVGKEALRGWLARSRGAQLPEAIFGANDAVAMGCIEVLAEAGIRVPEDVSVAGFDDTLGARTTVPQLTTVRQPLRAMGAKAVDLLLEQIGNNTARPAVKPPSPYVFPTELVIRASVSTPPTAPRMVPART
ncbi:MAG: LacI family DNA-binding transcriptional regulator, partial [Opitutaceae bacterium]|nr:LacI family DNA-binding transcriptional regulator [Opitutaceae bacterium]